MAKIKLHNPELAANSVFKNLVIETLTTDPTVTGTQNVGRLWFNNTDKVFKGTFLNEAGDNLEIKPIGIDNSTEVASNTQAIADEETARIAGDATLQTNIDTTTTNIATNTTNIATNTTDIATNTTDIATNTTDIATNTTDIATEATARANADTGLDTRITDLESSVGTNIGDLTTLTTDAKDNLVNALNEVDGHVDTNTTAIATNATNIGTNTTDITSNTTNITTNTGNIASNTQSILDLDTHVTDNYLNKTQTEAQVVTGETTFSSNLIIDGDLTVSGATTTIETETLLVADNKITLNNGIGAIDPTENAGLEVDRGNEGVDTILNWNETLDQVEVFEADELRKVATTNYVDQEVSAATGDITALEGRMDTAETNITSNDTDIATNTTAISDETTRATGIEANLQTELDAVETTLGASVATDGTYVASTTTNYIDANTSVTEDIRDLDTQVKVNADAVVTEAGLRADADTALDVRLADLEDNGSENIGDLTTLTTDAKDTLVNAINEVDGHTDTNSTDIATEITNRANADTNIQTELDATQTGAGLGVDGTYTADSLTNYITTATDLANADKLLDGQIKTNADDISALDTRVTNVETEVSGNIGDLTTLTTDDKDTLVNAINEVDGNIDTEVTNRTTADTTLQTNIDNEATARGTADTDLGTRIDNVNTAAGITGDSYTADATTNYLTTATDLMNADKVLDTTIKTNLDNLAATTTTNGTELVGFEGYVEADTNIVNPTIEIEAGTLKSALDDIASSVNTKIHDIENRYVKGEVADADKSDTYTLAHNLDTEFVDVAVQVYDAEELVWRFDLVVTEVIDANVVKISLASGTAEQIRYVIQGY